MPEGEVIKIRSAKGRPMLTWVGKQPLRQVTAFPAQHIETFAPTSPIGFNPQPELWSDWLEKYPQGGLLFHGDNKEVLAHLLANGFRGKVKLIYIDPPFDSGADYVRKVQLRGISDVAKLDGENYALGEQIQYTDIWANDNYLQFMYERLLLLKELLAEDGFLSVHMNTGRCHYIKVLLDEIMSDANFRNEIIVKRIRKSYTEVSGITSLNEGCDYILLYSKSPASRLNPPLKHDPKEDRWHSFDAPNFRENLTYELFGKRPPAGRHWMKNPEEANAMIERGELRPNATGWPEYLIKASEHIVRDTLWDDITASSFATGYPTEKKEQMIELVFGMASKANDLILDCFVGSGTAAAVAQKLGRRWIACDINKGAIQTTSKRLQNVICKQAGKLSQGRLTVADTETEGNCEPSPVQLSFTVWRVNDYDLQVQHNEAMELACEHIGITRTKNDAFFDGTRGKSLVKIIPFNHPLTVLDLEEIKRELENRPDEERDITVVCLGNEAAVDPWIEEWNKMRRAGHVPNRIGVIELRTDSKYGGFFQHEPAKARVRVKRIKAKKDSDKILVTVDNFVSPSIIERLKQQAGILTPEIDDWRAMVDCVMIDTAYDGKVFNITLSDIPAKKTDLVKGEYEISAPGGKTTVAVKIVDMLGEEVLITAKV